MKRPFWHNWSIPDKWKDCLSYAMQIKYLAKWIGTVEERVEHIEAGGATVNVYGTQTLHAGSDAVVENKGTETNAKLLFKIPQGAKGEDGTNGTNGTDGVTPHFQIGDVITLLPSEQATASITGTDAEPVLNLGIPQGITGNTGATGEQGERGPKGDTGETGATGERGPQGIAGADGVGISSIAYKETDVQGNNIYTITLTNNHQYDFTANRGPKGDQGIPGSGEDGVGIASITLDEELSSGNQYLVTLSNGQTYTFIAPKGSKGDTGATGATGPQGPAGANGADGTDGVGISTIAYKETDVNGNNVYTITLTNGNTYDFTANRGPQGIQGETGATGAQGPAGANGEGVPTGGTAGQALKKYGAGDYETYWGDINEVPTNGSAGQFLKRYGSNPTDVMFDDVKQVPSVSGVSSGDVLTADGNGGYAWQTPSGGGGGVASFHSNVTIDSTSTYGSEYAGEGSVSLGDLDVTGKKLFGRLSLRFGALSVKRASSSGHDLTGIGPAQISYFTNALTIMFNNASSYPSNEPKIQMPVQLWDASGNTYLYAFITIALQTKISNGSLYVRASLKGTVMNTSGNIMTEESLYFRANSNANAVEVDMFAV